jgi:hypothetical protein
MNWATAVASLGALIATRAGIAYIRSIIWGPTRPLRVTWGGWSLVGILGIISSLEGGAGIGLVATLPFVLLVIITFILSLNPKYGKPGGSKLDYVVGAIAGVVLLTQLIIQYSPVIGATVAVVADLVFLWPTLREAWRQPELEALRPWVIGAVAETLGIIALANFSYAAAAYPVYVLLGNLAVITALLLRRPKHRAKRRPT